MRYRLLTSDVVKDIYFHHFRYNLPLYPIDFITADFIKTKIVTWEYDKIKDVYWIGHINRDGDLAWV